MSIETIREFLGWCTVINFGMLFFGVGMVVLIRDSASNLHAKMFKIDEAQVRLAYFRYFAIHKTAIIVFNLVPYIALSIMTAS